MNTTIEKNLLCEEYDFKTISIKDIRAKLQQLIEDTVNHGNDEVDMKVNLNTREATLCEVQNTLLKYNILLPSDTYLKLADELQEVYDNYEPNTVAARREDQDEALLEMDKSEKKIKKKWMN